MNLKEYYKQLLSEEIKKSTPGDYALIRQNLGLPPKSTKENLGGTEKPILIGNDWNVRPLRVVLRTLEAEKDGRPNLFTSAPARNKTRRAAAQAFTGVRNVLLHGTGQNPNEKGLNLDALSSPTSIQRNQQPEAERLKFQTILNHSAFKDARHAVKHIFDDDLRPEHIEGLDINHPHFVRKVINKVASAKIKNMDRYDEDRPSIPLDQILGNLDTINSKGFPSTPR